MLSFDFCTKHATPLREPPGTGTSGNSFKILKTQTGQVPGAHFLRQIMFPDRSRPFPEVAGAHFLRQIIVPGPFPDVPGALFYDKSAISFGKMALFGVRSPRNLGAMQISLKMASQSDLKINTSTPKFEECFGKSIQRVFSQLSCLIHGLIIF